MKNLAVLFSNIRVVLPRIERVNCGRTVTSMTKPVSYQSHDERTAGDVREAALHTLRISHLERVNSRILMVRLSSLFSSSSKPEDERRIPRFKPGQWIDLFLPGLKKPGGFTITSSPPLSSSSSTSYLELAIQKSPKNPAAAYLWQPESEVLGKEVEVRVGGNFVFPPEGFDVGDGVGRGKGGKRLRRVVFVAGGVGINPFMSMLTYIKQVKKEREGGLGFEVVLLYSSKDVSEGDGEVLFLRSLQGVFEELGGEGKLKLFLTGSVGSSKKGIEERAWGGKEEKRRIQRQDLMDALGDVESREGTVCYVCGVPTMTDEFVAFLKDEEGMGENNVLCERWW